MRPWRTHAALLAAASAGSAAMAVLVGWVVAESHRGATVLALAAGAVALCVAVIAGRPRGAAGGAVALAALAGAAAAGSTRPTALVALLGTSTYLAVDLAFASLGARGPARASIASMLVELAPRLGIAIGAGALAVVVLEGLGPDLERWPTAELLGVLAVLGGTLAVTVRLVRRTAPTDVATRSRS